MKQTNSSLRQALEGGIDPLRPPEVRWLQVWVQEGLPPPPRSARGAERGVLLGGRGKALRFRVFESKRINPLLSRPTPSSTPAGPRMSSFWPYKVG